MNLFRLILCAGFILGSKNGVFANEQKVELQKGSPTHVALEKFADAIITSNGAATLKLKEIKQDKCSKAECKFSLIFDVPGVVYEVRMSNHPSDKGWLIGIKALKNK